MKAKSRVKKPMKGQAGTAQNFRHISPELGNIRKVEYHRFNIGKPRSKENLDMWWAENIERGVITAGFKGKPGDDGEKHLKALQAGDWVLAYASRRGYLGAGRVLADDTYHLHQEIPPSSKSDHKHERAVEWVYVIRDTANAISEGVAGLYHPVRTRQRVATENSEIAERLISLLRQHGEHLPVGSSHTPINLPPAIDDELKRAEEEEEQRPPVDKVDARERAMRAIVQRRGQGQFRESLLDAYGRRCAVTGCTTEVVLEAAHIVPYLGEHTNRVDNGLLLRSDIHTCQRRLKTDPFVGARAEVNLTPWG